MRVLVADIEADGLLFDITKIHQISIIDTGNPKVIESYNGARLGLGYQRLREADKLVMHNGIGYDLPAIREVTGMDIPWTNVIDTLVLSRLGNPDRPGGHSLEAWVPRLDIEVEKVQNEDWSKWTPLMERRCNEDCRITLAVYDRLKGMLDVMPDAVALEHATAEEVRKTIKRGFRMDTAYTEKLLGELLSEQEATLAAVHKVFPPILIAPKPNDVEKTLQVINRNHPLRGMLEPGSAYCPLVVQEFNPNSEVQIARRLIRKYGWKPTQFTPSGQAQVTEEILRELPYPEATVIADHLHTHKMVEQINAPIKRNGTGGGWLHHLRGDRVHPFLNPCRAVTGRLSCSSPNLQQVSTDPRMRRAWIPSEGYVLLGNDAEGLELRCLGHYLAPHDGGQYIKMLLEGDKSKGTDVHSVVMRLIGFYDRDNTKRAEYGWLYGAGDAKLGRIALQDAQEAGKEINYGATNVPYNGSGRKPAHSTVGKAIRTALQEGIDGLDFLVNDVKSRSKRDGKLRGLDGRTLWSRSDHSALNLILQSAGAILVKKAWTLVPDLAGQAGLVEGKDYGCVLQVHDEFQYEVREEMADTLGTAISKAIELAGEQMNFRCPLAGDFHYGMSWAETH